VDENGTDTEPTPDLDRTYRIANTVDLGSYEQSREVCAGDLNGDGSVNVTDLNMLIAMWGSCGGCNADIDPSPCGNGTVNVSDMLLLISNYGACEESFGGGEGGGGGGGGENMAEIIMACYESCEAEYASGSPAFLDCLMQCIEAALD